MQFCRKCCAPFISIDTIRIVSECSDAQSKHGVVIPSGHTALKQRGFNVDSTSLTLNQR